MAGRSSGGASTRAALVQSNALHLQGSQSIRSRQRQLGRDGGQRRVQMMVRIYHSALKYERSMAEGPPTGPLWPAARPRNTAQAGRVRRCSSCIQRTGAAAALNPPAAFVGELKSRIKLRQ